MSDGAPAVHRFEEHTGALRLRLFAPTFVEFVTEARRALASEPPGRRHVVP